MNTELMLVLPYCNKDIELLTKCVKWMLELQDRTGKYHPHHCMLVSDSEVPNDKRLELQSIMKPYFVTVTTMIVRISPDKQKWPTAPNLMFYFTARQMEEAYKLPWLWFEPDAVPLKAGWLDAIALAYAQSPNRGEDVLDEAQKILKSGEVKSKTIISSAISAADEIISTAEKEKADLVIIGSRGLGSAASRFLMGSVASRVATHAPCSVYITKVPGKKK